MKKKLSIKQQKNRERAWQYTLFASEFAVLPIPFGIMAAVNADEWFVNNPNAWQIGLGGSIGIALTAIMTLLVAARKENKNLTSGYIAMIIGWYAFGFVALLLSQIMYEIYKIMFVSGTGMIAAFGLDMSSKQMKKRADKHKEQLEQAEKELGVEQAKEEIREEQEDRIF